MRGPILVACLITLMAHVGALGQSLDLPVSKAPGKQLPGGSRPQALHLMIGGFTGPSYWVDLEGDTLTYRALRHEMVADKPKDVETKMQMKPTDEQWRQFAKALDEAQVGRWRAYYPAAAGLADGTQWSVALDWPGRSVRSSGPNNFPGRPLPERPWGDQFDTYLAGVKALLGGEDFQ
jgi:hypothetical protein